MATLVHSCNYVAKILSFGLFHSFLKSYSKSQDQMTYNGKVIFTFVVLPRKHRFQTESWMKAIEFCSNVSNPHIEWFV